MTVSESVSSARIGRPRESRHPVQERFQVTALSLEETNVVRDEAARESAKRLVGKESWEGSTPACSSVTRNGTASAQRITR